MATLPPIDPSPPPASDAPAEATGPVKRRSPVLRALKSVFVVGVVAALLWVAKPYLTDIRSSLTPALWLALLVAVGLNFTANTVLADNWGRLLQLLSHPLADGETRRIWGRAQLTRYAFGSAQLLSRPALAREAGVPLRVGVTSTLLETVWMTAVTATGVVLLAPSWVDVATGQGLLWTSSIIGVVALLGLTLTPSLALGPALWLLRRIGRPISLNDDHRARPISGWFVVNTLVRMVAFAMLVQVVGAEGGLRTLTVGGAAFLTGNLIGRLVIFAPGGLGPREAVSALLLQSILDPAAIIVVLAGTRLAELAAEGLFIASFRGPPPETSAAS